MGLVSSDQDICLSCERAFQDAVVVVLGGSEVTLIASEGSAQGLGANGWRPRGRRSPTA